MGEVRPSPPIFGPQDTPSKSVEVRSLLQEREPASTFSTTAGRVHLGQQAPVVQSQLWELQTSGISPQVPDQKPPLERESFGILPQALDPADWAGAHGGLSGGVDTSDAE